jgi:hypothetical protein
LARGVECDESALERWHAARRRQRRAVCIGDSITYDRAMLAAGIRRNWVDQLAAALDALAGDRTGDGYRGLWRDEWKRRGAWTQAETTDEFDVAPFRHGYISSGNSVDTATWRKPANVEVASFDLYWFHARGIGAWQYRIDDGEWHTVPQRATPADNRLHRERVDRRVRTRIDIRAFDGAMPSVMSLAGIDVRRVTGDPPAGTVVHNLGHQHQLLTAFCRRSAGDPLALLDELRPDLVVVLFSNDVKLKDPPRFAADLETLIGRVSPYADVLLVAPFEQRPRPAVVTDDDPVATSFATTVRDSTVVTVGTSCFAGSDLGAPLAGTNIPSGAFIASLQSEQCATMSAPATGSAERGELIIGRGRDAKMQAEYRAVARAVAHDRHCAFLDLYEAWAADFGAGWDAARAAGLMQDPLHPTQRAHDDIAARIQDVIA